MSSKGDLFPEEEVAKQLFPPTPEKAATKRDPLHRKKHHRYRTRHRQSSFRTGLLGALIFLLLCVGALFVTAKLNNGWTEVTLEDLERFFSNEPLRTRSSDDRPSPSSFFYFDGHPFLGFLGALPLALALGVACGVFTCLFMFYDSDEPGSFPPTPVSPAKPQSGEPSMSSEWHLGYLFVPINILVAFSLALFYLRWNMGLPMI